LGTRLKGQNHAHEKSHQGGNGEGSDADFAQLPKNGRQVAGNLFEIKKDLEKKDDNFPGSLKKTQKLPSDKLKHGDFPLPATAANRNRQG
jgi:hypothetical protein